MSLGAEYVYLGHFNTCTCAHSCKSVSYVAVEVMSSLTLTMAIGAGRTDSSISFE